MAQASAGGQEGILPSPSMSLLAQNCIPGWTKVPEQDQLGEAL